MPRVKVKVCGITNTDDALLSVELGADALGFIFAHSPRRIDVRTANQILRRLPPLVTTVGVFRDQPLTDVKSIMDEIRLHYAQLHGSESPAYVRHFNGRAIKVFHVRGPEILQQMSRYRAATFMLDTPKDQSGSILDYGQVARRAALDGRLILAGGLTPGNVGRAIREIRPYAVDVASGVETRPGKKSPGKLASFFHRVREAEYDLSTA